MINSAALVPFPNSYWAAPNLLLAGEYPGDTDEAAAVKRLSALLNAGVRTFVDLTDEGEINEDAKPVPAYRSRLRSLAEDERVDVTYARIPIVDRGQTKIPSLYMAGWAGDAPELCLCPPVAIPRRTLTNKFAW